MKTYLIQLKQALNRPLIRLGLFSVCTAYGWLIILTVPTTAFRYSVFPILLVGGWLALGLLIRTILHELVPLVLEIKHGPIGMTAYYYWHQGLEAASPLIRHLSKTKTPV